MGSNNSNEGLGELNEAFASRLLEYFKMSSMDAETLRTSFVDVLRKVLDAILLDDVDSLHKSCGFIDIVVRHRVHRHSELLLGDINRSGENPIKDANPVILATRHGKKNSLLCMSTELGRVLLRLGQKSGGEAARPGDVDEDNHTAFYYAMKSNDVSLMKIICEEMWSDVSAGELDDQLSRAYRELKLRNISLSSEMDAYVIGKLVDFRFFSSSDQSRKDGKKNPLDNIVDRVYFLLKAIHMLMEYMTRDHDSDTEVMVAGEYVAKSLDMLKYQLKSTYDAIPWEEMEFCVVICLKKYKNLSHTQMFYNLVLTPDKMSAYLGLFAEVLESRMENITQSDVKDLAKYPKIGRSIIVEKIKGRHRLFEDLYGDYEKVRDFHSLELMKSQVDLVSEVDWDSGEGMIVMTRALQVIGENLKKSIETPKLSTAEYLLRHFRGESRKMLEDLRDTLSKDKFLVLREQIAGYGEPFFQMLKADICELDIKITSCIYWKKEEICNQLAREVLQCGCPEEIQDLFSRIRFNSVWMEWMAEEIKEESRVRGLFQKSFGDQLKLSNELKRFMSGFEHEMLRKNISSVLKTRMKRSGDRFDFYCSQLICISAIAFEIENKCLSEKFLQKQKMQLKYFQEFLSRETEDFFEYNEAIRSGLFRIVKGLKPYLSAQELTLMKNIDRTILNEINMKVNRTRWIEELKRTLDANRKSKGLENSDRKILLASKVGALKKLLVDNNLSESSGSYDDDPKLRARVDMLLLDLMSLLSESHFSHNQFFLDHVVPVAIGKNLRNHLAHGNVLFDVLLSKQQVLSNAIKITQTSATDTDALPRKIDQVLPCDVAKVRDCFDRDMATVASHRALFMAARWGDVKAITRALYSGADVDGRDPISLETPLHVAALGCHYDACVFLCDRKANPLALDSRGRTPLHLAAGSGGGKVVAYLVGECRVPVDICDVKGRSPLLVAAETGQADVIQDLLELGARADLRSILNTTPSYAAALNGHYEALRMLLDREGVLDVAGGLSLQHVVAENGSVEMLDLLLKRGADVDARNAACMTPLFYAASFGNCEVIRHLVKNGADINATSIFGFTPLFKASEDDQCEAVRTLLALGADPNFKTSIRLRDCGFPKIADYILDEAILNKPIHVTMGGFRSLILVNDAGEICETCVKTLLDHGANIDDVHRRSGECTSLQFAVLARKEGMARTLIERGASTKLRDSKGRTALHYAAAFGMQDMCEILLGAHDIDVNVLDSQNMTPLDYAIAEKLPEIAKTLRMAGADIRGSRQLTEYLALTLSYPVTDAEEICAKLDRDYAVYCGVQRGDKPFLSFCLENNFDVNARDKSGGTALHLAAQLGKSDMISFLLENGATTEAILQDGSNLTALETAVLNSHPKCAELLIQKRSPIFFRTMCLAVRYDSEVLETLLNRLAGFDLNRKFGDRALLHEAATEGSARAAEILLDAGADTEAQTKKNAERPLHLAAYHGHRNVVKILLSRNAEIDALTREGSTPLHLAIVGGHANAVLALLGCGADPHLRHPESGSAFEQAVRSNSFPALRMLRDHVATRRLSSDDDVVWESLVHPEWFGGSKRKKPKKKREVPRGTAKPEAVGGFQQSRRNGMHNCYTKRGGLGCKTPATVPKGVVKKGEEISLKKMSKRNLRTKKMSKKISRRELSKPPPSCREVKPDGLDEDKLRRSTKQTLIVRPPVSGRLHNGTNSCCFKPNNFAHEDREQNKAATDGLENKNAAKEGFQQKKAAESSFDQNYGSEEGFKQNNAAEDVFAQQGFDGFRNNVHGFLLHIAAEHGFLELTRYLVEEGMDVLDLNSEGLQPLDLACRNGHSGVVSFLLDEIKEPRSIPRCLLHLAAEGGHCDVIEILLKVGVSINDVDSRGENAMHLAARRGHELALRKLLSHGAFFDVKNDKFRTPLEEADSKTELILRPIQRLFTSVKKDNIDLIQRNIEEGAYLNARCSRSMTPLLLASEKGSSTAVNLLLSRGADPNLAGPKGITPLHVASGRHDGEPIVRNLLCHGAIYESRSEDGKTPLQLSHYPSRCLLKTVDTIFGWLHKGKGFETRVVLNLKDLTDLENRKAVVRARDRKGRTLVAVATRNGFAKIDALKLAVTEDFVILDVLKAALFLNNKDHRAVLNASNRLLVKTLGLLCPEDPIVQEIRFVIAITHVLMGDVPEALKRHKSAGEIWSRTVGTSHKFPIEGFLTHKWPEEILWIVEGKFGWCESSSNLADCFHFIITKAIMKALKSPNTDSLKRCLVGEFCESDLFDAFMFMIGSTSKSPERALKYISQSHDIFGKVLGEGHPLTVRSLYEVAKSLSAAKEFDRALACYERLLKLQKERDAVGADPFTTVVQIRLGKTLCKRGRIMESLLVFKEVCNRESKNDRVPNGILPFIEALQRLFTRTQRVPKWFWEDLNAVFQ